MTDLLVSEKGPAGQRAKRANDQFQSSHSRFGRGIGNLILMLALLWVSAASCAKTCQAQSVAQTLSGDVRLERPVDAPILVWSMSAKRLENGHLVPPSKQAIFQASVSATKVTAVRGKYSMTLSTGHYCVFAFADVNGNGRWDPDMAEPFGSHSRSKGGRLGVIEIAATSQPETDVTLRAPTHFSDETRSVKGGTLLRVNGYQVLQLRGDAHDRGFAHGTLVAAQIIDFF